MAFDIDMIKKVYSQMVERVDKAKEVMAGTHYAGKWDTFYLSASTGNIWVPFWYFPIYYPFIFP